MKQAIYLSLLGFVFCGAVAAQKIPLPANLPGGHPRLMTTDAQKEVVLKQTKEETWATDVLNGIKKRIDLYVTKTEAQPDWMYSRLMMYWKSKATQVYIKGGVYDHADGEAPVPTVRFGSTRGVSSVFTRPSIDEIIPYMDDGKGVYFRNNSKEGKPLEWVDQSQVSGGSIESVNEEIMKMAKDAAFLYWLTGDEKYARFAFGVFDTYLMGMYYRTGPIDISHGHAQTLVGLSTFEVIQERILNELSYTYDFLYQWLQKNKPEHMEQYATTLKKWIDITIKNGVPHNNWDLHQAKFILKVAMVLEDDETYTDNKGRQYYLDYLLNKSSARQWSIPHFMSYGYDATTGIWNESPGYATGVTKDLTNFIRDYSNTFNQNLLPYMPVIRTAVKALPQYLFPNDQITAFGDSYYGPIYTEAMQDMVRLAQQYNNTEDEKAFTGLLKSFDANANNTQAGPARMPAEAASFFTIKPLVLKESIAAGKKSDYTTPTFYSPNVSWMVLRSRQDSKQNGLMISQYASYGNHMHANGVAIELYGKGYVLGAESGIGSTYFEKPYMEYYSRFPAHNTVMVDGISNYPEMLSNHPFDLKAAYPKPSQNEGYYDGITYSDVNFLEPESRSDQNRLLSIVLNSETSGYYVDIFRSKKQRGGEKYHDYFYHNLGQQLTIQDTKGKMLSLQPSEEMAFAGGHLFALDYMWDKRSAKTNEDYEAVWKMSFPDGSSVDMNLWMKGYQGREVFSINAPPCKAFRKENDLPYKVEEAPYLTIAARQHGEAWQHPFVSVFEPTTSKEGRSIQSIQSFEVKAASADFVGLMVKNKTGRTDYIFSSVKDEKVAYNGMAANATYGVISTGLGRDFTLFMGNGKLISGKGITITSKENTNAVLNFKDGVYYFTSEKPVTITTATGRKINMAAGAYKQVRL
ncbi:MAG: heparinase II/III family protein [Chitinophagaceae bacterium]|nr:heparinase II/III family protein [Chitinophagaceae bacterium]